MRSHSCASGHKTIAEAKLSWNFGLLCQDLHDKDKVQMTGALLYTNNAWCSVSVSFELQRAARPRILVSLEPCRPLHQWSAPYIFIWWYQRGAAHPQTNQQGHQQHYNYNAFEVHQTGHRFATNNPAKASFKRDNSSCSLQGNSSE